MFQLTRRTEAEFPKKSRFHVSIRRLWSRDARCSDTLDFHKTYQHFLEKLYRRKSDLGVPELLKPYESLESLVLNGCDDIVTTYKLGFNDGSSLPDKILDTAEYFDGMRSVDSAMSPI